MQRAARKDGNHKDIQEIFLLAGFAVLDVSQLKRACDIFVAKYGITCAIEIKDGSKSPSRRKLTEGELEFKNKWTRNNCGIWFLVETEEDALRIIQDIEKEMTGL